MKEQVAPQSNRTLTGFWPRKHIPPINRKVELVPWIKTWYVNLFGFVFGKLKVLEWPLSQKWDFLLYGYKFDKY